MARTTVFAVCLCYLQFPALADRQYQQQKWEHPISGDTSKQTSCVIAILIIAASIHRSQAPPICCVSSLDTYLIIWVICSFISVLTHQATAASCRLTLADATLSACFFFWCSATILLSGRHFVRKRHKYATFCSTTSRSSSSWGAKSGSSFSCWIVYLWHPNLCSPFK